MLAALLLFFALTSASPLTLQGDVRYTAIPDTKVPVQLGVMSRCPDALLCENIFTSVLQKVSDKVDLSLRYIAKLDPSEPVFGVKCMHGPEECAGNVQQLCMAEYSPSNWWEFIHCQNFEGRGKIGQPALAVKCAAALDIDWNGSEVGRCAGRDGSGTGEQGVKLLQESVKLSAKSNLTKSCTVVINHEKVCVHDGIWKECENGHSVLDFVRQIKDAYELLNED
ncbi:hypothetical protein APHAL10511_001845 [Amanita phalloides]|nr:hypothetical protein APHAL10511_001845 [Amanita phalloides]